MQVLHRLPDKSLCRKYTAGKVRMSEVHSRVENGNLHPCAAAQTWGNFALDQSRRSPQYLDIHVHLFFEGLTISDQILGDNLGCSHKTEQIIIGNRSREHEVFWF